MNEQRLQRLAELSERIALAAEMIALSTVATAMAVLIYEWIKLYRSLP